ncbi:MAG: lysostaphin resistance A-like protein [Planctomycetota bacterium]
MAVLSDYLVRIAPGIAVGAAFLALLPRRAVELRIVTYILLFVLARDAMTPLGMWSVDATTLRLPHDGGLLVALGLLSAGCVALIHLVEPELRPLVVWRKGSPIAALAVGAGGALAVAALPFAYHRATTTVALPAVQPSPLVPLAFMALLGNLLEEYLFRGLLQGSLEKQVTPARAALLSGVAFGLFHMFLALTVTSVGAPLLVFTVYEGVIAGFVRMRHGVLAAALAHGGGIFLIASGKA